MRDLSFTGCAEFIKLSILDIYHYISDCTCTVYFWQVCVVYVCLSVCVSSRPYLAGFLLSVSISELGQQVLNVELEAGTYRVPALITVD